MKIKADWCMFRWVCTGMVPAGICRKTLSSIDAKYFGSVILRILSKPIASQGRMVSLLIQIINLSHDRCSMNPEYCDVAFPSEPLNLNGKKSYSILRFQLSQISSEWVISIWY